MPEPSSPEWGEAVAERLNDDPQFERIASHLDATMLFEFGEESCAFTVDDGAVTEVHPSPSLLGWDLAVRAPLDAWKKLLSEVPPPHYNDLRGAWIVREFDVEGDLLTAIQHWRALKHVVGAFAEGTR